MAKKEREELTFVHLKCAQGLVLLQ